MKRAAAAQRAPPISATVAIIASDRGLLTAVFEVLWELAVRARARARQRHALAGRFAKRYVVAKALRSWKDLLVAADSRARASAAEPAASARQLTEAREQARMRAIRAVVSRAEGDATQQRRQEGGQQHFLVRRKEQRQREQEERQEQERREQERQEQHVHDRQRQKERAEGLLLARQEAERWFELQRWQLMLRCLRRWHTRMAEFRQRRHVREAKQFVKAQGRAPSKVKAKPKIDQRVFDQRGRSHPAPRRAPPKREPVKSKVQKAREAEAQLQALRDGDTSSLLSEGSSLWMESGDAYSGFGFAQGRAIGIQPRPSDASVGGGSASRYSEGSAATAAGEDSSAIWSDASSSSADMRSFVTTEPGDRSGAGSTLVPSDEDLWRDFEARGGADRGEMGREYHSEYGDSALSGYSASTRTLSGAGGRMEATVKATTRSGFRVRGDASIPPMPVEQQRQYTARLMPDSPPPSPSSVAKLESHLREKRYVVLFRYFSFWQDWCAAHRRLTAAQEATAARHALLLARRHSFTRWREQLAPPSRVPAQRGGSDFGDGSSIISAAVSSVSDPQSHDSNLAVYSSRQARRQRMEDALELDEDIEESIELYDEPREETSQDAPAAARASWEASTLGDDMKDKVRSLLAVQSSMEWDKVFEQASGVARPARSTSEGRAQWPWQVEQQQPQTQSAAAVPDQAAARSARVVEQTANRSAVDQLLSESMTWDADSPAHQSAMATLISPRNQQLRGDVNSGMTSGSSARPAAVRSPTEAEGRAQWPWQAEPQPPAVAARMAAVPERTAAPAVDWAANRSAVDQMMSESMTWDADCPAHQSAMATLISPRNQQFRVEVGSGVTSGSSARPAARSPVVEAPKSWPWQADPQPRPPVPSRTAAMAVERAAHGSAVDQMMSESATWDEDCPAHQSAMALLISPRDSEQQPAAAPDRFDSLRQSTEMERRLVEQANAELNSEFRTSGELDHEVAIVAEQIAQLETTLDTRAPASSLEDFLAAEGEAASSPLRTSAPRRSTAWNEENTISASEPEEPRMQDPWDAIRQERAKLENLHQSMLDLDSRSKSSHAAVQSSQQQLQQDAEAELRSESLFVDVEAVASRVEEVIQRERSPIHVGSPRLMASPRMVSSPRTYAPKQRPTSDLLPTVAHSLRVLGDAANSEMADLSAQAQTLNGKTRMSPAVQSPRSTARERAAMAAEARAWAAEPKLSLHGERQLMRQQEAGLHAEPLADGGLFGELPPDPLLHVFRFLVERDILHGTALVCKAWNAVSLDLSLWEDCDGSAPASKHCKGVKVDLRNRFVGGGGGGGPRREVLQLRMQRRVQRMPDLALLLEPRRSSPRGRPPMA